MNNKTNSNHSVNELDDNLLEETLSPLSEIYNKHSTESPDLAIDRQILAAAHRELLKPNKKTSYRNSFWRKISLPLYASATFAFTAIAIHVLMPTPVHVPPGTSAGPVEIELINEELKVQSSAESQININQRLLSEQKLLLEQNRTLNSLPEMPETEVQTDSKNQYFEQQNLDNMMQNNANIQSKAVLNQLEVERSNHQTNSELNSKKQLNKNEWARNIINLYKKGDYQQAQNQLKLFKKSYPDFPIDEQIEAFK